MTSTRTDGSVEFRFYRPGAREVMLAGDFSEWSPQIPMRPESHGWWTLDLQLEPGDYRFRYVADGEWYTDFASNGVEAGKAGWNSVLVVQGSTSARGAEVGLGQSSKGGALKVA